MFYPEIIFTSQSWNSAFRNLEALITLIHMYEATIVCLYIFFSLGKSDWTQEGN